MENYLSNKSADLIGMELNQKELLNALEVGFAEAKKEIDKIDGNVGSVLDIKSTSYNYNEEASIIESVDITLSNDEVLHFVPTVDDTEDSISYTFNATYDDQELEFILEYAKAKKTIKVFFTNHEVIDYRLSKQTDIYIISGNKNASVGGELSVDKKNLSIDVGSSKSVTVSGATGALNAVSDMPSKVSASVSGNTVTINALGKTEPNTAKVTITDGAKSVVVSVFTAVSGGGGL